MVQLSLKIDHNFFRASNEDRRLTHSESAKKLPVGAPIIIFKLGDIRIDENTPHGPIKSSELRLSDILDAVTTFVELTSFVAFVAVYLPAGLECRLPVSAPDSSRLPVSAELL